MQCSGVWETVYCHYLISVDRDPTPTPTPHPPRLGAFEALAKVGARRPLCLSRQW